MMNRRSVLKTAVAASLTYSALPILRALGPARTGKALLRAVRFLALWSWRPASPERTTHMYAPMSVTQEARRELRPLVAASRREGVAFDEAAMDGAALDGAA